MDAELRAALGRVMELIEANSHQIGVLSESTTPLEHQVEEIVTIAHEQNEAAKIQAQSVSALIEMLRAK